MSQQIYVLFTTSGSYSDYGVGEFFAGTTDPTPVLDDLVRQASNLYWNTWEEMRKWHPNFHSQEREVWKPIEEMQQRILRAGPQRLLEKHGYQKVNALEVHLDD